MKRALVALGAGLAITATVAACGGGDDTPTGGTYTIAFPSTAAAVATDFVQVLIFDITEDKGAMCDDLITARITSPDQLVPAVNPPAPPANICEMLAGKKPVTIPYGEHALLAIGERSDGNGGTKDFLIGCAIMTIGNGDAPLPIPVRLVNVTQSVPTTGCSSVGDFCTEKCH